MAGNDSQRHLLTLIRDYSSEKHEGERRIVNQKKRIEELRSELDASSRELEQAKRDKETTEQELKGYEVELSMNEASLQALEARIALTNNEISKLGSEMAALKNEGSSLRDAFIANMLELNATIRKFHEGVTSFNAGNFTPATLDSGSLIEHEQDAEQATSVVENKLAQIILNTNKAEQQYKAELEIHNQLQKELNDSERKASLLESVMKESMELEELSRQTTDLEGDCAAFGEELQKRFLCPQCNKDNCEEYGASLQMNDGT